jgi:glycerol-1-phosphate dehydrogenase [NAD(P)+]
MRDDIYIYVGKNAGDQLLDFCRKRGLPKLRLVADANTYAAAGQALEARLQAAGFDTKLSLLEGAEVIADERHFVQVMLDNGDDERTFIAIGSGSITDITRFVSYHTRSGFIAYPTAASVDGYTSKGAPAVIMGFKKTVYCHSPQGVFGDVGVLSAAPQNMIASGFGDMLAKYIALADWRLGELLWGETRDEEICRRVQVATDKCVESVTEIGHASPTGIQDLMDGLIESGLCMLDANNSRPASGAEHQISHHLEMKLLWDGKPAVLHGAKVGAATVICARYYDNLRHMSRAEAIRQLDAARLPAPEQYRREVAAGYPGIEDKVLAEQAVFMGLSEAEFEALKQKIIDRWADLQAIAASVPSSQQMSDWLTEAGGQTELSAFGFSQADVDEALTYSHLLRNRFNVNKLWHLCGLQIV